MTESTRRRPFPDPERDSQEARKMRARAAEMMREAEAMQEQLRRQRLRLVQQSGAAGRLPLLDPGYVPDGGRSAVLSYALDAAIAVTRADMGNAQWFDPVERVLRIGTQRGFSRSFLSFFERVRGAESACGSALLRGVPVIVRDVTLSPVFSDMAVLQVVLDAGCRSVISMPLLGSEAQPLGVLSVHFRRPRAASEREIRALVMVARRASWWLETTSG
jgi:hypothetical protein